MDVAKEFEERNKLANEVIATIISSLKLIDDSIVNNGYVSDDVIERSVDALEDVRARGWQFIRDNANEDTPYSLLDADQDAQNWARESTNFMVTTGLLIASSVRESTAEVDGLPMSEIEKNNAIKSVLESRRSKRAEVYAKDAIDGAVEKGKFSIMSILNRSSNTTKTWRTMLDDRVRLTHNVAEGQTVKLFDDFIVGGYAMKHPKDPSAPLSETINCRCVVEYSEQWSK